MKIYEIPGALRELLDRLDADTDTGEVDGEALAAYAEYTTAAAEKLEGTACYCRELKAKPPIKDGNQKQAQGYAGNYYITCRSTQQPDFYGPDKKRLDIEAAKKLFYAGCKVAVITTPWAYAKQGNRGVSADLLAVMFLGHGDAFSGRPVVDASDLPDVDPADLDPGDFTAGAPVRATEPDPTDNWI